MSERTLLDVIVVHFFLVLAACLFTPMMLIVGWLPEVQWLWRSAFDELRDVRESRREWLIEKRAARAARRRP